jgi:hypothetical protein
MNEQNQNVPAAQPTKNEEKMRKLFRYLPAIIMAAFAVLVALFCLMPMFGLGELKAMTPYYFVKALFSGDQSWGTIGIIGAISVFGVLLAVFAAVYSAIGARQNDIILIIVYLAFIGLSIAGMIGDFEDVGGAGAFQIVTLIFSLLFLAGTVAVYVLKRKFK